jgi:hypothetical protein
MGFSAVSANAATATADARARILAPITVTKNTDLDFGTIVVGTTAGTATVSTAGARTCTAALVCTGGTVSAANFSVSGTSGAVVTVATPASVSLASGANNMSASLTSSAATVTLTGGTGTFNVGGVLSVGASQAAGNYVGTFTVTVDYQ